VVDKSTKIINYKFKQRLCTETVWEEDCPLTCGPHGDGHLSAFPLRAVWEGSAKISSAMKPKLVKLKNVA